MVVQHNMQAANASRMLNITASAQSKSTEKLSSGYKINRAADDAAGLTISEKMRKQIRGLDRASTNAEDGVSAVQTAEGALTEVHSMLQRMNELAVQSANGTNSSDDRDAIQSEIDQLTKEIDRVSETTKFNETYLLKGGANNNHSTGFKAGASIASFQGVDVTAKNAIATLTSGDQVTLGTVMLKSSDSATIATKDANAKATNLASAEADDTAANGGNVKYTLTDGTTGSMSATKFEAEYGVTIAKAGKVNFSLALGDGTTEIAKDKTTYESGNYTSDFSDAKLTGYKVRDELKLTATVAKDGATTLTKAGVANPLEFNLHVGSESASNNKISVTIESMSAAGLGIDELKVDTESNATSSIDTIEAAIKKVSSQRSNLGAIQNRLEHTIDNLDNVVENTTSAESRIRDTDMADEMVKYSKNNILQQAGQSMLAQANQSTQGVLSLLQ